MNTTREIPAASKLMNKSVKCVAVELSLRELVGFFLKHDVSCAPVVSDVDDQKTLLGFVSQGDALSHLSNQMFSGFPQQPLSVAHVMKRHPVAISPDTDVFSIASIFNSHGYRHVPVVDQQNRLQGLVSRREVLSALMEFSDSEMREFDREHFRPDVTKIMNHRFILSKS
jgi:CBS-domain-containing membrane protein